ncbi:deoxyguanosinetriphosphate triphosphohydrolase family protein [Halodesulfurarchaeum formicicum]|uniref:dGTPase n=1 Tax=Halodesulfurarchaeum formicicum TaxID=1873524 RepID=A0A1J1ACB2_9EURY|nr:dNTP triphosphohydrolase [Halodesulfurarchaeum formicicum]APE95419.1 dGTPase [Halodesulfurarchaeum formicicum]
MAGSPKESDRLYSIHIGDYISGPFQEWGRAPFERDLDRVKYTRAFRRLKDVTQVARSGESYLYHDRLSHSLKVGQVGRRIAELALRRREKGFINDDELTTNTSPRYPLNEILFPPSVEAACLAHDIGHPPFGHISEDLLNELLNDSTNGDIGYEGNAQSFRIVTRLADGNHSPNDDGIDGMGLGLTRSTLNGMLKYPWGENDNRKSEKEKWGYYPTEKAAFEFARETTPSGRERSLSAEIMDYADDLTYAIHDVTDFYKAGLIPLDQLLREAKKGYTGPKPAINEFASYLDSKKRELVYTSVKQFFRMLGNRVGQYTVDGSLMFSPFNGTPTERRTVDGFTSMLIGRYISGNATQKPELLKIEWGPNGYHLQISQEAEEQIWLLRQLTDYYVIKDSSLMAQQRGQKKIIKNLFEELLSETAMDDLDQSAIPEPYRSWLGEDSQRAGEFSKEKNQRARVVADMITTMTEPQAIELHDRLLGYNPGALQNHIIR